VAPVAINLHSYSKKGIKARLKEVMQLVPELSLSVRAFMVPGRKAAKARR
jgi:hypothetical protein